MCITNLAHRCVTHYLTAKPPAEKWIITKVAQVYVCKSVWPEIAKDKPIFAIRGIEIAESLRGQGLFKQFLETVLASVPSGTIILFEDVTNDRLLAYLLDNGFVRQSHDCVMCIKV